MDVREKDDDFFGRGAPAMDLQVTRTEGSFVYAASGKRYLDFLGGAGVGNLGWGVQEIESAIRHQSRPNYIYPNFYYRRWSELAELLANITPGKLRKSFRVTGGSEAVEAALEMATMYTGRKKILSVEGSYHGNTLGALSIGASSKKESFPNLLQGCEKIDPPLNADSLEVVEKKLATHEFAAFIMEPIIVNLGVVIPEEDFMKGLDRLCKQHGTLLIMDEAITGFGRTGKMFASEYYEIKPDILCMAKAITAGYAPMGAVIATEEIALAVQEKIGLYSSYGWHPVAVDASIAALNFLLGKKDMLFNQIDRLSKVFEEELSQLDLGPDSEIRIKGLAIGVDLKDADRAADVKQRALQNGLLMNSEGSTLVFLPNFLMEEEQVREGVELLGKSL